MGITLTEPIVKREERQTKDGEKYTVFCVCVFAENDGDDDVEGDVTFWAVYPGAQEHPIESVLCTKSEVKVPKMKKAAHGEAKGREQVCCCASEAIINAVNQEGSVMAAWGKKDHNGEVLIGQADVTKKTSGPIKLPPKKKEK